MLLYLTLWPSASRRRQFTMPKIPEFPQLVAVNHTGCSDWSAKISYKTNPRLFCQEPQKGNTPCILMAEMNQLYFKKSNWTNTYSFFPPTTPILLNISLRKCNDLESQMSKTQEFSPLRIQPTYNESHLLGEKWVFWQGIAGDTGK